MYILGGGEADVQEFLIAIYALFAIGSFLGSLTLKLEDFTIKDSE